jgi:hypothetical protein
MFENPLQNSKTLIPFPFPFRPSLLANPAKGLRSSPLAPRPSPASQQALAPARVPAAWPYGPAGPAARSRRPLSIRAVGFESDAPRRSRRACAADLGAPPVIPFASSSPPRTPPPPRRPSPARPRRAPRVARTPRRPPPGLFKAPPPLDPNPSHPKPSHAPRRNPSPSSPPPPSIPRFRRRFVAVRSLRSCAKR